MLNRVIEVRAVAERLRRRRFTSCSFAHDPSLVLIALFAAAVIKSGAAAAEPRPPGQFCAASEGCARAAEEPKTEAAAASARKWHPGHYMQVLRGSVDSQQAARFPYYDAIGNNPDIEGVSVWFRWSQLEPRRGDYAAGIQLIRAELDKLKSLPVPKRLVIQVLDAAYGSDCPASDYFPSYLSSNGSLFQTMNQCVWRRWDATTMGYFIDLMAALGDAFDGDPYVEMISPFHETAIGWNKTPFPSDFSDAALETQYRRLADAMSGAWPTTIVRFPTNWGMNESIMSDFVSHLESLGAGAGNPDICPSCDMAIDSILSGDIGGRDYRGVIPIVMGVEVSELGYDSVGPDGGFTVQEIYDYAHDAKRSTHILWDRNVVIGNSSSDPRYGQQWPAMLNLFSTQPIEHTDCPRSFADGCRTD
ncbi:MAG: hypothetical protein JXB36_00975 [Gammaproteobacteria bacterium]|nr:hypothetical protein [Gammaproteobacteria bacterium]